MNTYELAIAKLESSGLTMDDAMNLGIEFLDPHETTALHSKFNAVPSLKLPYFDPYGQPLSPFPKWPAFYRLRYLKTATDFKDLGKKPIRYVQEPESGVCAYFPRLVDWPELLADSREPLLITEGELKAAKASKEGLPTIGLGGVYNFRSAKLGVTLLPELKNINWVKRYVYLCYDSDYRSNPNICRALNELAEALMLEGALPHLLSLPDVVENGKTGLDDFLVAQSSDDLRGLLHDAVSPLTLARPLLQLNERVTFVQNPGLVVMTSSGQKLSPSQFKDNSTVQYAEQVVKDNGSMSLKMVPGAAAWLKWPLRREVGKLTYAPGQPQFISADLAHDTAYNTWPGWAITPKAGDVSPFLELVRHVFKGTKPADLEWFLRWCAYPIKYPGVKLFTSVVIHGRVHGTGKSLIGYSLGRIYGKNFTEIKQQDLHAGFNEWAENKQFVLADDVTGSDRRADADLIKKMITQRELRLNPKYIPSYVVPDCINYLWTSNQPDAFFLEDGDRRFFVHEVTVNPLSEEFYLDYDLWLDTGGSQAIFQYLLDLDTGDFNPAAPALRTSAKERMTDDVRSDLGTWVRMLIDDPDSVLRVGQATVPGDLFSNRLLLGIYDPSGKTRTTANGLGRELSRAGVRQVLDGQKIRTSQGFDRYYAIRNRDKWLNASTEAVRSYLTMLDKQHSR